MSTSYTRSSTQSSTYTSVVHITRKVQTDILEIGDTYDYFTESFAQDVIHDVRIFIDEEAVDYVKFVWTKPGSARVLEALRYQIVSGAIGLADDRPGGIRYDPALADADFSVLITYSDHWKGMAESERKSVRDRLELKWGSAGRLDYSGGSWSSDRTYSMNGSGAIRTRFSS